MLADQAERLAWLAEHLPQLPGSGIVYCLTVADTQRVATFLRPQGIDARAYNAALSTEEREALEDALVANEMKALVATVALGMGFDKPDLGFVVHYQRPGSAIAYYQQVGRAGRAVDSAYGVLLSGREDDDIAEWFMRTAFPPTVHMHEILAALERRRIRCRVGRSSAPSTCRRGRSPRRSSSSSSMARSRATAVDTSARRTRGSRTRCGSSASWRRGGSELAQMQAYMRHDGCYMEFLTDLLDDPAAAPCGRCSNDVGSRAAPGSGSASGSGPRCRSCVAISGRSRRGSCGRPTRVPGLSGRIKPPNEIGCALCVYGDAGWGRDVQRGKYVDGRFSRELVVASARAIRDRWRPQPEPAWVTPVPSGRSPGLIEGFAQTLAGELGLPYEAVFAISAGAAPQASMQNSAQQLENVHAKLSIDGAGAAGVPAGPVLLVDDIVDTRWTLTLAGHLLRGQGVARSIRSRSPWRRPGTTRRRPRDDQGATRTNGTGRLDGLPSQRRARNRFPLLMPFRRICGRVASTAQTTLARNWRKHGGRVPRELAKPLTFVGCARTRGVPTVSGLPRGSDG